MKRKPRKWILLCIFFIIIIILLWIFWPKEEKSEQENTIPTPTISPSPTPETSYDIETEQKLSKLNHVEQNIDYFKMEYLDRYLAYKEQNETLSDIDIVTRVNIGLDQPYYTNTKDSPYKNEIFIISNKYYSLGSYEPDHLETIAKEYASGTRQIVHEARVAFETLAKDAKAQGYTIRAMSAYRSYEYQVGLYQRYVDQDGQEEADTYSARPGFSEHQTGLVVDVDNSKEIYTNFHHTKEYQWMKDNAYKYGFIERYPKGKENITGYTYESWHYRYVGVEIATYIHEHDITFDEYYVRFIEGKK